MTPALASLTGPTEKYNFTLVGGVIGLLRVSIAQGPADAPGLIGQQGNALSALCITKEGVRMDGPFFGLSLHNYLVPRQPISKGDVDGGTKKGWSVRGKQRRPLRS